MPPPPVLGGRRLRLQSPQYTGRSDIGSNGSSSIAFPQSAHFRSRCRTSTIRLSPKPIRSPFCSLGPSSTDCRRRSLQTDTVPQSSAKGKTASPRALRDARRPAREVPDRRSSLHGRGDVCMTLLPQGNPLGLRQVLQNPGGASLERVRPRPGRIRRRRYAASPWRLASTRPPSLDPCPFVQSGSRGAPTGRNRVRRSPEPRADRASRSLETRGASSSRGRQGEIEPTRPVPPLDPPRR